jgi:CheY-like chemotaxis protein
MVMHVVSEPLAHRCLGGVRVLVVDDDEDLRASVLAILQCYGAEGDVAECAGDARQLLAERRFDVLLSDIEMPNENGYDFIRSLRRGGATAGIAAAAVTARTSSAERARALAAGFDRVVGKPLEVAALVAAVRELAGTARARTA